MQKHTYKIGLLGGILIFAMATGSAALALSPQGNAHAQAATNTNISSPANTAPGQIINQNASASAKEKGQAHLEAARLKSCQNRQKAITNIMTRIANRGQKQLTLFGTIATRVENFYVNKGKTFSQYDNLVAEVNAKQTAAQATVDTIRADSSGFNCDGADPKSFVNSFQTSLKAEISALQDYKASVKNLIVGVKSVQTETTSSTDQTARGNQ